MSFFIKLFLCLAAAAIVNLSPTAHAETLGNYIEGLNIHIPNFSDYPVKVKKFKAAKSVDFSSNEKGKYYRTLLTKSFQEPADFAGKYVIATNGCGAGCQMNWILDKENGKIVTDYIETRNGLDYRKDSNLLVVNPYEDLKNIDINDLWDYRMDVSYYAMTDGRLKLVKKISLSEQAMRNSTIKNGR